MHTESIVGQATFPARHTEPRPEHPPEVPLAIHDFTVAYQRKPVLWDIELNIPEGKLVGIVGPNGAGKSTLLKACLDLVPRASGWAHVYGVPYRKARHRVAYVPQRESVDWDFPVSALMAKRSWTPRRLHRILQVARRDDHLEPTAPNRLRLSEAGFGEAARVTRNHRLWETYLIQYADIAPSHVDRDADLVEHILGAELVRELEAKLSASLRDQAVPPSPHPLGHA